MSTELVQVPLAQIRPSATNPRRRFDQAALDNLAESIRQHGVLQPVLVRPDPTPQDPGGYELIAGERRWRAAKLADLATIPAQTCVLDDREVLEIQLVENLQRDDLHPLDECDGYRRLHEEHGADVASIAARVGRSPAYVYSRLKLANLTEAARVAFDAGRLTAGHAVLLSRLQPDDQARAMDEGPGGGLWQREDVLWSPGRNGEEEDEPGSMLKTRSVRELQAWIDRHVRFEPDRDADPVLFPETSRALGAAWADDEKCIPITWDYMLAPDARAPARTFTQRAWKRADGEEGSEACDHSVLGIVVAGPGRGEAYRVCTRKDRCKTHWAAEMRAESKLAAAGKGKASGAKGKGENTWAEERKREEQKREREAAQWEERRLILLAALAERILSLPVAAEGALAEMLIGMLNAGGDTHKDELLIPRGASAEDLVRHVVYMDVWWNLENRWRGVQTWPKAAKILGLDPKLATRSLKAAAGGGRLGGSGEQRPKKVSRKVQASRGGRRKTKKPAPKTSG